MGQLGHQEVLCRHPQEDREHARRDLQHVKIEQPPPKVKAEPVNNLYNPYNKVAEKTVIEMRLSIRSIDLDFKTGVFGMSGMMTLEWTDSRYDSIILIFTIIPIFQLILIRYSINIDALLKRKCRVYTLFQNALPEMYLPVLS